MVKILLATVIALMLPLGGCVVAPYDAGPAHGGCPPGQAKKGNCRIDAYGNETFCPPGKAKKGQC